MKKWKGRWRRGAAIGLASLTFVMSTVPYLPQDILTILAAGKQVSINVSAEGDHDFYLSGRVSGEDRVSDFLCLNEGAKARTGWTYTQTNKKVGYKQGDLWEQRLFWAYISAFGSYDGNQRLQKFADGICSRSDAKQVAWKRSCPPKVDEYVNEKFMSLANVPAGCKSPQDIFNMVSKYGTPETAMSVKAVQKGPNVIDAKKLYEMMGLDSYETLKKVVKIIPVGKIPDGYVDGTNWGNDGYDELYVGLKNANPMDGSKVPDFVWEVTYDPNLFQVYNISGEIEYFTCDKANSQQLCRVKGDIVIESPKFYITNGSGNGGGGGNGGDLNEHDEIEVKIYEHQETFESNYEVDLTKKDYETGLPLKDSRWQVLEKFTDQDTLSDGDESDGQLVEANMSPEPTSWENWLIFEGDMLTDENGFISHHDTREYNFDHKYCDGHPKPAEPEKPDPGEGGGDAGGDGAGEGEDDAQDEYEELLAMWQEAVDECQEKADASNGTFHHWVCDEGEEPTEEEAFEKSGCKDARDSAYENFINLRYSYTFREEDARDGYILHGQNGHPDDVPVEIITTAASEAGKEKEWTQCSNEDIVVTGQLRDYVNQKDKDDSGDDNADVDTESVQTYTVEVEEPKSLLKRIASVFTKDADEESNESADALNEAADSNVKKLYLSADTDLSLGQVVINKLRHFFGLSEKYASQEDVIVTLVADDPMLIATPVNATDLEEMDLINDLENATLEETTESSYENVSTPETDDATEADEETISEIEEEVTTPAASLEETKKETSDTAEETDTETVVEDSSKKQETSVEAETEVEAESKQILDTIETEAPVASMERHHSKRVGTAKEETVVVDDENDDEEEALTEDTKDAETSIKEEDADAEDTESTTSVYSYQGMELDVFNSDEPPAFVTYAGDDEDGDGGGDGYIDLDSATIDSQPEVDKGPSDRIAHHFVVYDHRVPGQIHINKRDMDLKAGENADYDSYADTQGDSTLEGAVYGLFAATDIYHPDTQRADDGSVVKGSGIVFDANDLVAIAATDKNGDASFLTITEKPHTIYDYKAGETKYTGKTYPKNLYDKDGYTKEYKEEETGRIYRNNMATNGDYWIGRPLILGDYYIKELNRSEGYELSITGKDMTVSNVNDATRDNYGESDDSKSHPVGSAWIIEKLKHAVTFPDGNASYGNRENLFTLKVGSNNTTEGYNVVFDGLPENADFYVANMSKIKTKVQVAVGEEWVDATEEPLFQTANAITPKKDKNGNQIANPNGQKTLPLAVNTVAYPAKKISGNSATVANPTQYSQTYADAQFRYVKYELEQMMRQMGIETPKVGNRYSGENYPVYDEPTNGTYGMPEVTIRITNVTTNGSLISKILDYYQTSKIFTYGSLQKVTLNGSTATVTLAVAMSPRDNAVYETDDDGNLVAGYLMKLNPATKRFIMRRYEGGNVGISEVRPSGRAKLRMSPDYTVKDDGTIEDQYDYASMEERFLCYQPGDILYEYCDADGTGHNPLRRKEVKTIYEKQEITSESGTTNTVPVVASKEAVADPVGSTYVYYDEVSKQYTLHIGSTATDLTGSKTAYITAAIADGSTTLTDADIAKIGNNNVWGYKVGDSLNNSEYIMRISGAGAGVFACEDFDKDKTFIRNQRLIYNGNHDLGEDGNTQENPTPIEERIIKQQIKVTKTIEETSYNNTDSYSEVHEDWFTKTFGSLLGKDTAAKKLDNFRYKVYLKSNLERLYRDNDGNVIWQDRSGNEIDVLDTNRKFPELVNKIYTKVQHVTDPLYKDSEDAIISNDTLYSYTNGLINENQNTGYTAILETVDKKMENGTGTRTVKAYNYDKLFDAIHVANNDKWDDDNPTYTSWQPIGNAANRTTYAVENAKASDMVRQFAIDWYLDDEIAKLVKNVPTNAQEKEDKDGSVPYADEMYDEALHNAIIKAENYLKPFFAYDLDEIYAIAWDSAENGGSDHNLTTLSADTSHGSTSTSGDGYYFATSQYLPYGTYVVAEQQPTYDNLEDFKNKHYQIDKPREVTLPAVYASYDGSQASPEVYNTFYNYNANIAQKDMERLYKIRFNEEALRVIKGRNAEGDFEVYKYGMDIDRISNGVTGTGTGDYFALTQDEFKPYKNYYNPQDDRTTGNVPYYLTEGLSGREKVSKYYRYSSVAENAGTANDVAYPNGTVTEDNVPGVQYRDNVKTMQGVQIAYDGKYASMLVPWSVAASDNQAAEVTDVALKANGESSYKGFTYTKFRNRFFTTKLRIEKLDSETHENILHDGAVFNIYAAQRDDSKDGNGAVKFYDKDTLIVGTEEFLEAMGASDIKPAARRSRFIDRITGKEYGPGNLYTGVVPAGTPICDEEEQITLGDSYGTRTAVFKSYSTVKDGQMKSDADNKTLVWQNQTVGYLETPQPLGAGVYVICEVKAPTGYTRSKPIAVEVYSDKVTYYKEANKDNRVLAAMYEYPSDNLTTNGTKPQDLTNVARINVENAPIKLEVEKIKESSIDSANTTTDKTVTYKVSGRIDGKLSEIGNNPDYEYAYSDAGDYLGYAWKKGTLEYLAERQAAGEQVQIAYEGNIFAGYGFITRKLETSDDTNKYVAGATMTLFDALELHESGDTQDHKYDGLVIERDSNNNITRMYVEQGYAGRKVEFIEELDDDGNKITMDYPAGVDKNGNPLTANGSVWTAQYIERPDTDILYYDLDKLEIFKTENSDGNTILYGYDRNHDKVTIKQLESDKQNFTKTDSEYSIFAFKGGLPYLEFVGGDFNEIHYSATDKVIEVGDGTLVYHIDRDGNRDALVDPYTGMAYVKESSVDRLGTPVEKTLVWAVNVHTDEFGNKISVDKITTSRIATVGENLDGYNENQTIDVTNNSGHAIPDNEKPSYNHTESGYITGTWKSANGEESHKETTVNTNEAGQNMNEDILVDDNNGSFDKSLNPTYDEHGLVDYYQRSNETYDKGTELYDRNGDFVRYQDSDNLEEYNNAAYRINEHDELYDGDETKETQTQSKLYHRQGEGYVLENTWVTSDKTPNDPFATKETDGQPDVLKRVPFGTYIMEEIKVPDGYLKGMPTGVTVFETADMQHTQMIDKTTKVEISKIDGTDKNSYDIINMETGLVEGTVEEGKNAFGYGQVADAIIALYKAKKVYTSDFITYPKGYYLERVSTTDGPITYFTTDSMVSNIKKQTAQWTTGTTPIYVEGIPEGYYLLQEIGTPEGFATSDPLEVYVSNTAEVQNVIMHDDHTKVEIAKNEITNDGKVPLSGAGFTLYKGNADGTYNTADVVDSWITEDATDFTEVIDLRNYPNANGKTGVSGFKSAFEEMYRANGTTKGTSVSWSVERKATRTSETDNIWVMEDRTQIPVVDGVITFPAGMSQEDKDGFLAAYNANTKNANEIKWVDNMEASYVSHTQIDGATVNGNTSTTIFPTSATLLFKTTDGRMIEITAYQKSADDEGLSYQFDYKFDYKKLDAINAYACSYLTETGHRRFDYLPIGSTYVLVETTVPEGYAKADDRVITVKDMMDVQLYSILNETTALRISKVRKTDSDSEYKGEIAGAKMALFKANASGDLEQTSEYLVTSWTTGEDGVYTEDDFVNGLIPNGYKRGDLRPHTIRGLENGTYYLVELEAPGYYKTIDPMKIEYVGQDEIQLVRAYEEQVKGKLEIDKVDTEDTPLTGVTFQVTGYRYGTGEVVYDETVGDTNGKVTVLNLPTGEPDETGTIIPYVYKVREITPPDGYAASPLIRSFQFTKDNNGVSFTMADFAEENMKFEDEKTKVYISKRDFTKLNDDGIDGAFIDGAVLAVYELNGRDADDNYIYDENAPIDKWTSSTAEPRHLIEGLVAGRSYLLKELKAPTGYNYMKPVVFTLSTNGRSIYAITNNLNTVTVNYITPASASLDTDNLDVDSIDSVTVEGRYVSRVDMVVTDSTGAEVATWVCDGTDHKLYRTDGLDDGQIYTFTEYTTYSDGSKTITDKTTKRAVFDENGVLTLKTRKVSYTSLAVSYTDGTEITHFTPNEYVAAKTIKNNVNPENPKVTTKSRGSENGDALDSKQAIINTVSYTNTANQKMDVTVTATVSDNADILESYDGTVTGKTITWKLKDVDPSTSGYVTFTTQLNNRDALSTIVEATVSCNGKTISTTKETPVMQPNMLTIYNELTGSGKELYASETTQFRVRLYSSIGEELKGSYNYYGSQTGQIRSGDIITLAGNDFITINPSVFYKNAKYSVERIEDGSQKAFTERYTNGFINETTGAFALYTRSVKDTSEREIFTKGESYLLVETTVFSDGEQMESNKLQFTLNEKASISAVGGYDKQTEVRLSKTDITTGEELPGAHIILKDKDGKTIDEWISTDKPHTITGKLTPGESYTMIEEGAPDGYAYAEDITFTVNEDGSIDKVVMEDKKTDVSISKTDITTGEELPGAHLVIKDKHGNVVEEWTSTDKPHEITGKLVAGETYTLIEEGAPDGYAYAESITFTVSKDGSIDRVIMEDKPTHVSISKTDITTDKELPGAHIVIKDKNGKVVDEWTSTDKPHEIVGKLIAGETYTMIEEGAPNGYAYAADITFTVSRDGSIDKVVMQDKPTHVNISKVDITTGVELPGAHITIKDKDGNVVDEWTSTDKPHEIVGKLNAGETYTMIEEGAPDGYGYAESINFTVSKDGSIDTVVMEDKPTHVTISKVDITTSEELPGAQLIIKDKNGEVVEEWISTDKPHELVGKLIAGEKYTLIEITAPNGYKTAEQIEFTVNRDGSVTSVVMKDQKIPRSSGGGGGGHSSYKPKVVITKRNVDGGLVEGAEYGIFTESGTLVASGTTGATGIVTLYVAAGKYYIQEISSPTGYALNTMKYPITVSSSGVVEGKVDLVDDFAKIAISKLDVATLEPLNGAVFTLFTLDGKPVATATSGSEGYAEFSKVLHGSYYIMETDAPDGYILSPEKRYVSVDKFYVNAAPIIWYNNPDTWRVTPKTGDNTPLIPVAILLFGSLVGYLAFTRMDKRKKEEDQK